MKKLLLLAAMLALLSMVGAPALAEPENVCEVTQEISNEGDAESEVTVEQEDTETDDIEIAGSSIIQSPELEADCVQTIEGAAGSNICEAAQELENEGNAESEVTVEQEDTETDDITIEGSLIEQNPELAADCNQTIIS